MSAYRDCTEPYSPTMLIAMHAGMSARSSRRSCHDIRLPSSLSENHAGSTYAHTRNVDDVKSDTSEEKYGKPLETTYEYERTKSEVANHWEDVCAACVVVCAA